MPNELEAKFRVDSHEPIRSRLRDNGATFIGCVIETNHILDRKDGSLRTQGCGIRVRIAEPWATGTSAASLPIGHPPQSPLGKGGGCGPLGGEERDGPSGKGGGSASRVVTLTFKGPRQPGPFKSREEIETVAADADALLQILERLGLQSLLSYEKKRESWTFGPCRIELDEPPHIGLYVEIEGPNNGAIRYAQALLQLPDAALVRESYVRLLTDYCAVNGMSSAQLAVDA